MRGMLAVSRPQLVKPSRAERRVLVLSDFWNVGLLGFRFGFRVALSSLFGRRCLARLWVPSSIYLSNTYPCLALLAISLPTFVMGAGVLDPLV